MWDALPRERVVWEGTSGVEGERCSQNQRRSVNLLPSASGAGGNTPAWVTLGSWPIQLTQRVGLYLADPVKLLPRPGRPAQGTARGREARGSGWQGR